MCDPGGFGLPHFKPPYKVRNSPKVTYQRIEPSEYSRRVSERIIAAITPLLLNYIHYHSKKPNNYTYYHSKKQAIMPIAIRKN
jgi:hypothetical protein